MADHRAHCPTEHPAEVTEVEANAFRIVPASGPDYFLDFLFCIEKDQEGVTVARIRVHERFLESIRDRLKATLIEIVEAN